MLTLSQQPSHTLGRGGEELQSKQHHRKDGGLPLKLYCAVLMRFTLQIDQKFIISVKTNINWAIRKQD